MTLLEKLELLPSEITYKLPFCASGVNKKPGEKSGNIIWSEETGIYDLDITKSKTREGVYWDIRYVYYNMYEGYPEIYLPAKPEEDIISGIKEEYNTEDIETWMVGEDNISANYSDTDLEKTVDKVLEWLEKEGLLS